MNEELKVIIRAELAQFKKAMNDAISGLRQVANEGRKASKEIDGFTADVNQQGKALQDLKKKYVDLAAAHGKESKAAKDAAEQIKKLSAEYKTNKTLATDLANEANNFDLSLGGKDTSKDVGETTDSVEELQSSLESIQSLSFGNLLVGLAGPEVREKLKSAMGWFQEYRTFADQAAASLRKNSWYYGPGMNDWEGWKGAWENWEANMGEATGAAKLGFQRVGEAGKVAMSKIGAALKGVIGALLIVVINIVAMVKLFKNALNVAKEVKAMANQASKAGMETSTYQEWGYVLKQVGIEEDKLSDFTKKLAERQNELRDGSEEAEKAFEALGISAEEAMGSNQEQLFRKSVVALQNVENSAERTSLAFRVFTDDATDLTNLLYLTNEETSSLIDNYYALGGAPSDNLINKSKILEGSTTNLSYAWQGLKNTLAEWVIPAVTTLVQWVTTAVAWINVFLQGVLGVEMVGKKAGEGIDSMGGGLDKVGDSADKTTKKVKELLRYTMGFDELNVIPKQNTDSGSGSDSGSDNPFSNTAINPDIPVIAIPDLSKFRAFMDEYGSIIQGILTWGALLLGIGMIVAGVMSGSIAMIIGGASIVGLGVAIGAAGGEESHWNKLAEGVMNVISSVVNFLKDALNEAKELLSTIGTWIYDNVISPVAEFFKGLYEDIKEFFAPADEWFRELWTSVKQTFEDIWNVIKGLGEGAWEGVKQAWSVSSGWFSENVAEPIKNAFSEAWAKVKNGAKDAWQGVKNAFSPITNWFKEKFEEAWEKVKNVFSKGGELFKGFTESLGDAFKVVVNWLIDGINKVIKAPFDFINGVLNKVRNIEFLGISPFKDKWSQNPISIPQIPKLATGGITNGATMALIGEAGKEAVLPLDRNTEWMDVLAARINNNTPSKIVLMLDGKELGWANINSINNITKQTGQLQLVW